jgi:hypothetical protein
VRVSERRGGPGAADSGGPVITGQTGAQVVAAAVLRTGGVAAADDVVEPGPVVLVVEAGGVTDLLGVAGAREDGGDDGALALVPPTVSQPSCSNVSYTATPGSGSATAETSAMVRIGQCLSFCQEGFLMTAACRPPGWVVTLTRSPVTSVTTDERAVSDATGSDAGVAGVTGTAAFAAALDRPPTSSNDATTAIWPLRRIGSRPPGMVFRTRAAAVFCRYLDPVRADGRTANTRKSIISLCQRERRRGAEASPEIRNASVAAD